MRTTPRQIGPLFAKIFRLNSNDAQPAAKIHMKSDCPAEPSSYRLFFLDENGRIKKSRALECANDEAAIDRTHQLADGRTLELYDGCRLVLRILREEQAAGAITPVATAPAPPR